MKKQLKSYGIITLGSVIFALAFDVFFAANQVAMGGITGLAQVINALVPGLSVGTLAFVLNIPLFLAGWKFIGWHLLASSLYSLAVSSLAIDAIAALRQFPPMDPMLACLCGGALMGFGLGLVFSQGATTGGTDIVSKFINTRKPSLNFFWGTFVLNAAVAAASFFVYAAPDEAGNMVYDYKPVCLCMIYSFLSSFMGNSIISGSHRVVKFTVITAHPEEITRDILSQLHHSATQVTAVGAYGKETKQLLICVVNRHQIVDFRNILRKYDDTFSFSETVDETYGNFRKVK